MGRRAVIRGALVGAFAFAIHTAAWAGGSFTTIDLPTSSLDPRLFQVPAGGFDPRITIRDDLSPSDIVDTTNQFPNVVLVEFLLKSDPNVGFVCSGSLINSRTVLTAGHCVSGLAAASGVIGATDGDFQPFVFFGNDALNHSTRHIINGTSSVANPGFDPNAFFLGDDLSMISLSQPVYSDSMERAGLLTNIPYMQLATTAPSAGDVVTMVGYGLAGTGSDPGSISDFKRRVAANIVQFVAPIDAVFDTGGQPGVSNQIFTYFDDPLNPTALAFGFPFDPTGIANEGTTNHGDSGGPLLVPNGSGGWIQVGITSGGANILGGPDGGYGDISFWTSVADFSGPGNWIATANPLQAATDGFTSGLWSDPGHWLFGVVPDDFTGDPNAIANYNTPAFYYDVLLSSGGVTTTLDDARTVDSLSVINGASLNVTPTGSLFVWSNAIVSDPGTTLRVDGSIDVNQLELFLGARLQGNGSIASFFPVANFSGTVAPGNSIGTLTINGDFMQGAAGTLEIEVSSTAADLLKVNGNASLDGLLKLSTLGTPETSGELVDVVTTTGLRSGTFAAVDTSGLTGASLGAVLYGSDFVRLLFGNTDLTGFADDPLEQATAGALDTLYVSGSPAMHNAVLDLLMLDDPERHLALEALNPVLANMQPVSMETMGDLLRNEFGRRSHDLLGGNVSGSDLSTAANLFQMPGAQMASADPSADMLLAAADAALSAMDAGPTGVVLPNGFGFFAAGDLALTRTEQPAGIGSDSTQAEALTGGLDWSDGEGLVAGAGVSYLTSKVDQNFGLGGDTKSTGFAASAYGDLRQGRFYADGYLSFGWDNFDTQRLLLTAPFTTVQVTGSTNGRQYQAGTTMGYEFLREQGIALGGVGGLYYMGLNIDGYTENGSILGAVIPDRSFDSLKGALGAEASLKIAEDDSITPFVRVLVNHEFLDNSFVTSAAFAGGPTVLFTAPGPDLGETWPSFGAGLSGELFHTARIYVRYEGDINRVGQVENTFSAAARIPF